MASYIYVQYLYSKDSRLPIIIIRLTMTKTQQDWKIFFVYDWLLHVCLSKLDSPMMSPVKCWGEPYKGIESL